MLQCMTWVWELWDQWLSQRSVQENRNSICSLNNDIMIEIFKRLPADSVLACISAYPQWSCLVSSQYVAEAHLKGATPTTFVFLKSSRHSLNGDSESNMFFIEDFGTVTRFHKVHMNDSQGKILKPKNKHRPYLVASCNGLILFRYIGTSNIYVIYNPLTQEIVTLSLPGGPHKQIIGLFFDHLTKEYKCVLFHDLDSSSVLSLYGLKSKKLRKFCASYLVPDLDPCVNLPRALFWKGYQICQGDIVVRCSKYILMFDLEKEEFRTLPHPGDACNSTTLSAHQGMRLLAMDGSLVFSNIRQTVRQPVIDIWVLEDSTNVSWVKKYVVNLSGDLWLYPLVSEGNYYKDHPIQVFNIVNGELLLNWPNKGVFWYNLQFKTVRKIAIGRRVAEKLVSPMYLAPVTVPCTKSFVSPKQIL